MQRSVLESLVGGAVIAIAAAFLVLGLQVARPGDNGTYALSARFLQIGGLEAGNDVRINGIKVGTVVARRLDPKSFEAVVELAIASNVGVPSDSEATIAGDGLLGDKYVRLIPGSATEVLKPGERVAKTRDYKSIEDAVSEIIYLATGTK